MNAVNLNVRTDRTIKKQAEELFSELGLNMSVAINAFLRTAVREQRIPFELKLEVPNETTQRAIEEGELLLSDPNTIRYTDIATLKEALEA